MMARFTCMRRISRLTTFLAFAFSTTTFLSSQAEYHVAHYTSKQGLPQNSIRGLAFDAHGFLWLATEGGIARFNGHEFVILDEGDHPGVSNQRFTHLLPCQDTGILFIDHLNGMYSLSGDRFKTLREPDARYTDLVSILGSLPSAEFLIEDSLFLEEATRAKNSHQNTITVLPIEGDKVIVMSDRIVLWDPKVSHQRILSPVRQKTDQIARLANSILFLNGEGILMLIQSEGNTFEQCRLVHDNGTPWTRSLKGARIYNQYPFEDLFIKVENRLYRLSMGSDRLTFTMHLLVDALPENLSINAIDYRQSDDVLAIGTDARGLYIYHRKHLKTYKPSLGEATPQITFYAQCILDSSTLLTSNGLLLDINSFQAKGAFEHRINEYLLVADKNRHLYYTRGKGLIRYDPVNKTEYRINADADFTTHCITILEDTIWIGTNFGAGQILGDSIRWVHQATYTSTHYGIKSINKDLEGHMWFGSYFDLYKLNRSTSQLDSFAIFTNTDVRDITRIKDKLFIGTYGHGYYVYHHGKFTKMPRGRHNELSNTHTFIADQSGHLWMSTNRGLYKTHLDAIDAYLLDTTFQLDYYAYLEEDGILNTEFNGGCSPSHLALPDGRYSLPSLEGLVVFDPMLTPHYFPKDSVVIEYIEVDGSLYRPEQMQTLPADHSNVRVYYASAWWNRPNNQHIYLGLESPETVYRLSDINQTSYSLGRLSSGSHTFVIRRRCGFGPQDFVYSRLIFNVEKEWYERGWIIGLFLAALIMLTWGTTILYSRSIRKRNILLRRQVDEQTKELLASNVHLEENLSKLAKTEINLRKNIKVRDRLISIITHDILTPLRFIGQIARHGAEEKPTEEGLTKRALKDVQNAVHKLFHSTQNLLHWVTYHQENFKSNTINCSPFALVEQLMEDFSEMSRFQGNVLINEVPEDDVILTDPRILTIILHNLLSNAIKYTQNGKIAVRSSIETSWYILEVRDTGRGMTSDQLAAVHLGTMQHGEISVENLTAGNGIGLSLVADLVQALHGRWEIDSREGSGVHVRIFISLDPAVSL